MMWSNLSDELINLTKLLVDERVGIVKNLTEKTIEPDEPPAYLFNAHCRAPMHLYSMPETEPYAFPDINATGCAWTREEALWSTLGESVERYAAQCWQDFSLTPGSYNQLKGQSPNLEDLIFYSDEQYSRKNFKWLRFDPDAILNWHSGVHLNTDRECLIPATLIWIDYLPNSRKEHFYPQVSTGLACGSSTEHVIHGGIREAVERDAFACNWCISASPPAINITNEILCQLDKNVTALINNPNYDINIRWITTDIDIPVVFVLVRSVHHEGTTVGAACHPNAIKAIEKAITEAIHGWRWLGDLRRDSQAISNPEEVTDFKGHVKYYLDDRNIKNLAHYYNSKSIDLERRYIQPSDILSIEIEEMVAKLAHVGYQSYYTDITPQDVIMLGFEVGKIIIPGLQPLASGYGNEHFDIRRIEKFAAWLSIENYELCIEPHPFP
ncbi:MAG: ribosomal protein S12 methylthiotransferase accessory factor [Flavobacteriales bacterium]|jgi:ribosomal protein S12 methylthiotransferase accessory factor